MLRAALLLLPLAMTMPASPAAGQQPVPKTVEQGGFRLPEGFACRLYADDDFAHDISCMTFDSQGRVVVSGPGYIKTLLAEKDAPQGAPKAKQAVLFSSVPKSGAQGLCF
ncbi:MAG TPA: hypothetical protein VLE43_17905, partial [Candidatus Saccharimonadia bacterium]|nr:hypothetical protein [Candidatus Saccharimonadia bacterium]